MSDLPPVPAPVGILLAMTAVTGIVDAVSYLALGHVFTANMTGNLVLLGFAFAGASGLSISRSAAALIFFGAGAVLGGRMAFGAFGNAWADRAFFLEAVLLGVAAISALGMGSTAEIHPLQLHAVIAVTALSMGLRNAVVRKLAVPDMTTTVLTLTITGLAADSSLAGGDNPRWQRRSAAILAMIVGAFAGASIALHSIPLALSICCVITGVCALARQHLDPERRKT
jgi:uncharacterized membrane protein YoaK (UPF0700 family)